MDSQVALRRFCHPEDVKILAPKASVLIGMDLGVRELEVFNPDPVPWLGRRAILVETHDAFVPGMMALLKSRFEASHTIVELTMQGPEHGGIKQLQDLRMFEVDALVGSERPGLQSWLWLKPLV